MTSVSCAGGRSYNGYAEPAGSRHVKGHEILDLNDCQNAIAFKMRYELAKQLFDAGFPQGGGGTWSVPPEKVVSRREDRIYAPSLEELIEAVGPNFHYVLKLPHEWKAFGVNLEIGRGQSAIDAVARLWLAINSRQQSAAEQRRS